MTIAMTYFSKEFLLYVSRQLHGNRGVFKFAGWGAGSRIRLCRHGDVVLVYEQ